MERLIGGGLGGVLVTGTNGVFSVGVCKLFMIAVGADVTVGLGVGTIADEDIPHPPRTSAVIADNMILK